MVASGPQREQSTLELFVHPCQALTAYIVRTHIFEEESLSRFQRLSLYSERKWTERIRPDESSTRDIFALSKTTTHGKERGE